MRNSLKNQLNTWREVNRVPSMEEILKMCTHPVKNKKSDVWALVVPHASMSIENNDVVKIYMAYRVNMIKLKGMLRNAIANDDVMEQELLSKDMSEQTTQFYDFLRDVTGQDFVLGIDHDSQQDISKYGLLVNIYPIKPTKGQSQRAVTVSFKNRVTDEERDTVCVIIPYKKGGKDN